MDHGYGAWCYHSRDGRYRFVSREALMTFTSSEELQEYMDEKWPSLWVAPVPCTDGFGDRNPVGPLQTKG